MKPSTGHVRADVPTPPGTIPAPVQISTILPKPQPATRPETYSVVVNNVNVQELLFALARDAKLNVDVHSGIKGLVTLNAIEQTLPQLLSRIAKQVDMRWELDGPNLLVMADTPYLRVYKVDYVNIERQAIGTVGIATQIATPGGTSGGGAAGGGGASNTSTARVSNSSSNKFWDTLVENIKDILKETDKVIPGGQAQGAAPGAAPPPGGVPAAPAQAAAPGQPQQAAAQTVSNVTFREAASVISNPETGVLSIRATSRQHEKIQEFLDQVLVNAKRQVLIEATIAEVQLNNQYQQGIDWSLVRHGPGTLNLSQSAQGTTAAAIDSSLLVMSYAATGIGVTLRLLESFGNVRVLSSPKISVLNNQMAILRVVDNLVYFSIKADTTATANVGSITTFTTTPNIQPIGFTMNVTPQISDNDTVLLNLRPTVTRLLSFVNDPNPTLASAGIVNRVPQVQTREMESMIKVNSGQIAVMGGLIQDSVADNEDAIPGLSEFPFFTRRNRGNTKTELVVFIRPMVVRDPSIDGDFRAFRSLAPDENFISQRNPGKPAVDSPRP